MNAIYSFSLLFFQNILNLSPMVDNIITCGKLVPCIFQLVVLSTSMYQYFCMLRIMLCHTHSVVMIRGCP